MNHSILFWAFYNLGEPKNIGDIRCPPLADCFFSSLKFFILESFSPYKIEIKCQEKSLFLLYNLPRHIYWIQIFIVSSQRTNQTQRSPYAQSMDTFTRSGIVFDGYIWSNLTLFSFSFFLSLHMSFTGFTNTHWRLDHCFVIRWLIRIPRAHKPWKAKTVLVCF